MEIPLKVLGGHRGTYQQGGGGHAQSLGRKGNILLSHEHDFDRQRAYKGYSYPSRRGYIDLRRIR